jgi:hypothetical protein
MDFILFLTRIIQSSLEEIGQTIFLIKILKKFKLDFMTFCLVMKNIPIFALLLKQLLSIQ